MMRATIGTKQLSFRHMVGLTLSLLFLVACDGNVQTETNIAPSQQENPDPTAAETSPDSSAGNEQAVPFPDDPAAKYADLNIVTLLPPDAIPAIDNPQFLPAAEADDFYDPDELVMGVTFNGDARAYSVPFLSNHEIVNDTVGGEKIAVTW